MKGTMMLLCNGISLTVVLLICAPLNNAQESNYIVGGVNAKEGELPYQVSLQSNNKHICGGSIINHCYILTAAHCVVGKNQSALSILAGTTKLIRSTGKVFEIEKIIMHEKYDHKVVYENDIALLKLRKCVTYSKTIYRVKLSAKIIGQDVPALVSGWGFTDQNKSQRTRDLKKLEVKTSNNQYCRDVLRLDLPGGNLCTFAVYGKGFCQGDSGGPLVEIESETLIGIVSANIPCAKGYPDIYTRISTYYEWIKDHVK